MWSSSLFSPTGKWLWPSRCWEQIPGVCLCFDTAVFAQRLRGPAARCGLWPRATPAHGGPAAAWHAQRRPLSAAGERKAASLLCWHRAEPRERSSLTHRLFGLAARRSLCVPDSLVSSAHGCTPPLCTPPHPPLLFTFMPLRVFLDKLSSSWTVKGRKQVVSYRAEVVTLHCTLLDSS